MAFVDERFPTLVRQTLIPVLARHGFEVTSEDTCCVETVSQRLQARAVFDPRGELDVEVFPLGFQTWAGWSFTGMVGRASLKRLLELAVEQMQSDPRILEGDPDSCSVRQGSRPAASQVALKMRTHVPR